MGANKTIAKAKQIIYWPFMSNDIKQFINSCESCIKYKRTITIA